MKDSVKVFLIAGVLLVMACAKAEKDCNFSFIGTTFDNFLKNFVPEEHRTQFVNYYNKLSKLFGKSNKEKQDATHTELFKKALTYLKKAKYDAIIDQIKQLRSTETVNEKKLQNIQRFLTRCGVYADFLEMKEKVAHYKRMKVFAHEKFDDFLDTIVAKEDHESFTRYYEKLANEIAKGDELKRTATHSYLFRKALDHIKLGHVDWHNVLSPYSSQDNKNVTKDPVIVRARLFLRRYGAYREFLENKALIGTTEGAKGGIFTQIGFFFSNIGKTVAGWFGFGTIQTV